jgi:hypothetical protein
MMAGTIVWVLTGRTHVDHVGCAAASLRSILSALQLRECLRLVVLISGPSDSAGSITIESLP